MKKIIYISLATVTIFLFMHFVILEVKTNETRSFNSVIFSSATGANSHSKYNENHGVTDPLISENYKTSSYNISADEVSPDAGTNSSETITITEVSPDGRTYYHLQSNGSSHLIEQDPARPDNLHAVFMVATDPIPWNTKSVKYFFSSDMGANWIYLGDVFTTRAGFPSITLTSDGRAVVGAHCTDGGGLLRTHLAIDLVPGVGAWTILDPGTNGNTAFAPMWPVITCDRSNNKVIWAASLNGVDSAFVNVCVNLNLGTFLGYRALPNGETAQKYSCAVGSGKYGVAFNTLSGGAAMIESTNQGVSWGSPTAIWNWSPTDSMGTLRGIDCGYSGSVPNVVFEVCHVNPVEGTWEPQSPSKIYFWAPDINNGNPIKIDSAGGLTGSNTVGDVYVSVCRPVIGYFQNSIFVAYSKARSDTSSTGINYFDIYVTCSGNHGASWSVPVRITNNSGPLVDCRYVSISEKNSLQAINLLFLQDSIPGTLNNSLAKMMYAKVSNLSCPLVGITNTNNEIPKKFILKQNYPNPFNPKTLIEFGLPIQSFTKVIVYNIEGQKISALITQKLTAGNYKIEWDGTNQPSGVYFYVLETESFTATKKMILVK